MEEAEQREKWRQAALKIGLAEFVERTTNHRLDHWQRDLCARLETLAYSTGRRVLIAAPPQMGKSIIVSQRFPAWMLTRHPYYRIKLACYNVTHSTRFGKIVRDLMQEEQFAQMFPDPTLQLPKLCAADEWATAARASTRDSQPSFKALGLATGFVGQGADLLILDDPYASPDEAYSTVINERVHRFWSDTARPRLNDDTNVVVMFHRYTERDLAGWLMESEPDDWELIRYAARSDGDYEHPVTKRVYKDPMQRPPGERLSPRYSEAWYDKQQQNEYVWLSQFQGRPTAKEGSFFKVGKLEYCNPDEVPSGLRKVRAWDLAASKTGDWTAGALFGKAETGRYFVLDMKRGRWLPDDRDKEMTDAAEEDGKEVKIRLPQDPAQAGVDQALRLTRLLDGYRVKTQRVSGDKMTRAEGLASQVNAGNVTVVRSEWQYSFTEELRQFPLGSYDDQVDAAVDAYQELAGRRVITAA